MEQLLYLTDLFDLYGALLTERQQKCLEMHLFEDFSLSEIGERLGISRQAVYDNIHRSQKSMEDYESKLGLVARYRLERMELKNIYHLLKDFRQNPKDAVMDEILIRLSNMTGKGREV